MKKQFLFSRIKKHFIFKNKHWNDKLHLFVINVWQYVSRSITLWILLSEISLLKVKSVLLSILEAYFILKKVQYHSNGEVFPIRVKIPLQEILESRKIFIIFIFVNITFCSTYG